MTLKTRRLLFYSSLFLFIVAALLVIFYSMGFRVDFANKLITETGGIYVKSDPVDASIALDGDPVKNESGILNTGTLIDNLEPKSYNIVLNADGYSGWEKNADVTPGGVAIFDSIILVSDLREKIYDAVNEFRLSNELLVTQKDDVIEFDGKTLTGNELLYFTRNGGVVTRRTTTGDYYLSNVFDLTEPLNLSATFNNLKETELNLPGNVRIVEIEPYPFDDTRFVIMTGRAIYTLDTDSLELDIIASSTKDFVISGNDLFWLNEDGISNYDLLLEEEEQVYAVPAETVMQWSAHSSAEKIIILSDSKDLISFDVETATTTTISLNASYFSLSPDGGLITFVDQDGVINVYDFEWEDGRRREQLFKLKALHDSIDRLIWYGGNTHLIIKTTTGDLRFIEIDDFMPINEVLISANVLSFVYDEENEFLYYSNDLGIWRLKI